MRERESVEKKGERKRVEVVGWESLETLIHV